MVTVDIGWGFGVRLFRRRSKREPLPGIRTAIEAQRWYPGYRQRYKQDWQCAHHGRTDVEPSYWARGNDGIDAWITDTPDWDRAWFQWNGMLLPRFGEMSKVYWHNYGDGLRGLSYSAGGGPW